MTALIRLSILTAAAFVLSACSLFGDDEEELEPLELTDIETTLPVKRLWEAKIGGGAEFLRVALRPAGDGNRIYAASRNGNVVALHPETGKVDFFDSTLTSNGRAMVKRRGSDQERPAWNPDDFFGEKFGGRGSE